MQKEIQPNVGAEKCVENDGKTLGTGLQLRVAQATHTALQPEAHEAQRNLSPPASAHVLLFALQVLTWRFPGS